MGDKPIEIDWNETPANERREYWQSLNAKEQAFAWKYAIDDERQAIANITDQDLNELEARARNLPEHPDLLRSNNESPERTNPTEKGAKFELKRIHRERVETELEGIRKAFLDYAESTEKRSKKRRAENVYILVALGIIGGYFSYNSGLKLNTIFQQIGLAFVVASSLFILIKVITVRISDIDKSSLWSEVDNKIDILFAAVITGVFVFGTIAAVISIFNIQSSLIQNIAVAATTIVAFVAQLLNIYNEQADENKKSPEEIHDELIDNLFRLPDSENVREDSEEIVNLVHQLSKSGALVSDLQGIKDKIGKIDGVPSHIQDEMISEVVDIINEREKEEKTEDELRAERVAELEEQREKYHGIINDEKSN